MARPLIVVTGWIPQAGMDVLATAGDVVVSPADDPQRADRLSAAAAIVTLLTDRVDHALLDAAPSLQIVANVAVGHDNIDIAACHARGVHVTNTPGVLTDATADLAMGLILMSTRRLGEGERLVRSGEPWAWSMSMMLGTGVQGRRLGIIGMGGIGTALARRARAFGLSVVYHNRRRVDRAVEDELAAELLDLDDLLATSDIVSLHCPHTDATHHLIDRSALETMKRSAHLVNTARGPIVDEAALAAALAGGTIAGAALDVFEHEPDVHPALRSSDRVVLLPHLGSATVETRDAMATTAARNVVTVLDGGAPLTPVLPPKGDVGVS